MLLTDDIFAERCSSFQITRNKDYMYIIDKNRFVLVKITETTPENKITPLYDMDYVFNSALGCNHYTRKNLHELNLISCLYNIEDYLNNHNNYIVFSEALFATRSIKNLTQEQLCKKSEIPLASYRKWEQSVTQPSEYMQLAILAHITNV